ncbi:MAG: carbohydrate-binding domain-containing protein, partial [Bacilli bacterium]
MKKIIFIIFITLFSIVLVSCQSTAQDPTLPSDLPTIPSDLVEPTTPDDTDWNEQTYTSMSFLENTVIASDYSGIQVSSTAVAFVKGGIYVLSGSYTKTLIVSAPDSEVRLVFNNLEINSSQGSSLIVLDAEKVILDIQEGTDNYITDSSNYGYTDSNLLKVDAAIYSKADLVISGTGSLSITANYNDGIKANDALIMSEVNLTIHSVDDAITVNDSISIESGNFNLFAGGDAIKVSNDNIEKGEIFILGGNFFIDSFNDGLQSSSYILIQGGVFEIIAGDGYNAFLATDQSSKGIKATLGIEISGGTIEIDSADDAIHSDALVSIVGGTITIKTGEKGIHSDNSFTISDGTVTIENSFEGIEAKNTVISGGFLDIYSIDDGINGSDPEIDSAEAPLPNETPDSSLSTAVFEITGGVLIIESSDDAIDINGIIYQKGGIIVINGPVSGTQSAVDYDLGWVVTGGTLIGVAGYGNETKAPSESSTQLSVVYNTQTIRSAGTTVSLKDADNNLIFAFTPT